MKRSLRAAVALLMTLAACGGDDDGSKDPTPTVTVAVPTFSPTAAATPTPSATVTPTGPSSQRWVVRSKLDEPGQALAVLGERVFAASGSSILVSSNGGNTWEQTQSSGLPRGFVNFLAAPRADPPVLLAHVWGKGLYRSEDEGDSWTLNEQQLASGVLTLLNPRAPLIPFDLDGSLDQTLLAGPGGLFLSGDAGETWTELNIASPGKVAIVQTGAAVRGDRFVAVSQNPVSVIPQAFAALVEGGVYLSDDAGATWRLITSDLGASAYTDTGIADDGTIYVTTADGGLFRYEEDETWTSLGGPEDALSLSFFEDGISVASASRGVWRFQAGVWTQEGNGPVAALASEIALGHDGTVYGLEPGLGNAPPTPAGGVVHLALSFHTNLYHSFRGDTNDDQGFGLDIRVIRNTLDWLDRFPEVCGDWDIENAFSLDDVLPRFAPDIIERIGERLATGKDGLRIMSWNNGAVASETHEEFAASIDLAKQSYQKTFGTFDPGVQPQENMFSPDHVGWYRDLGIDWITLFNSATPFTAFPLDQQLTGRALYNPVTLVDGEDEIILVPEYHHADMLDHGGLRAWVRQISDTIPGDTLLLLHMDADSEFWVKFDLELEALRGEPSVRFTTIQDYLDTHGPVDRITLPGDLADGVGDGFASWAEKLFNHEIATGIARAREDVSWARMLAGDDATVADLIEEALRPRLLALSTTHFGLASPFVVEDRQATARARTEEAIRTAGAALAAAEALDPLPPQTIQLVNARDSSGMALVEIPLEIPAGMFAGTTGLILLDDDGGELPVVTKVTDDSGDPVWIETSVVIPLTAGEVRQLTWSYDPDHIPPPDIRPSAFEILPLGVPFTECDGVRTEGQLVERVKEASGNVETFRLGFCDGSGSVVRRISASSGLPGFLVEVSAEIGNASNPLLAESVALSPLSCPGEVETISWQTFGERIRTRPARLGQETWNGQSADGWIEYHCKDSLDIRIAHRVSERTSLAFAPLRNDQGRAVVAPLGTLWGDSPWHDSRRIGGLGIGDIATGIVGSQFRPAAPDWSGATVEYRILAGANVDRGTLDLFAHPPLVRVGR